MDDLREKECVDFNSNWPLTESIANIWSGYHLRSLDDKIKLIEDTLFQFVESYHQESCSNQNMEESYRQVLVIVNNTSRGTLLPLLKYLFRRAYFCITSRSKIVAPKRKSKYSITEMEGLPSVKSKQEARLNMNVQGFLPACSSGGYYKFQNAVITCSKNCTISTCNHETCGGCGFLLRVVEKEGRNCDWQQHTGFPPFHANNVGEELDESDDYFNVEFDCNYDPVDTLVRGESCCDPPISPDIGTEPKKKRTRRTKAQMGYWTHSKAYNMKSAGISQELLDQEGLVACDRCTLSRPKEKQLCDLCDVERLEVKGIRSRVGRTKGELNDNVIRIEQSQSKVQTFVSWSNIAEQEGIAGDVELLDLEANDDDVEVEEKCGGKKDPWERQQATDERYFDSLSGKKSTKSICRQTEEANKEKWKELQEGSEEDSNVESSDASDNKMHLVCMQPDETVPHFGIKRHQNNFRLDRGKEAFSNVIREVVVIVKEPKGQVVFNRQLDRTAHGGLDSNGFQRFIEYLGGAQSRIVQRKLHIMENDRNHPFDEAHPLRPVVVNVPDTHFTSDGKCVIEKMNRMAYAFAKEHLKTLLEHSTDNGRGVRQINVGYTGVQASEWSSANDATRNMPGIMSKAWQVPMAFRVALGELLLFMSTELTPSLLSATVLAHMFLPSAVRYELFTKKFMRFLGLPLGDDPVPFLDAIAAFVTSAGNSATAFHFDKEDDHRNGFDGHITCYAELDFSGDDVVKNLLATYKMEPKIDITFVGYTRRINGDMTDIEMKVPLPIEGSAKELCRLWTLEDEDLCDVGLFESRVVDMMKRLYELWKRDVDEKCHEDEEFGGRLSILLEQLSLFLYISSFQHSVFMLFTAHRSWLIGTFDNILELLIPLTRTNGQQRFYCVLLKWRHNKFFDGRHGSFQQAFKKYKRLSIMYCIETWYMGRNRENRWHSGTDRNRYQISSQLPYDPTTEAGQNGLGNTSILDNDKTVLFEMVMMMRGHKHDEDNGIGLAAYNHGKKNIKGHGHMLSQNAVRFLGALEVVDGSFVNFGTIDGSPSDTSGPAMFIRDHSEEPEGGWTSEAMTNVFHNTMFSLKKQFPYICGRNTDQGMCNGSRRCRIGDDNLPHDKRKYEIIFYDEGNDFSSIQNIFRYKQFGNEQFQEFRYHDKWRPLHSVLKFWKNQNDTEKPKLGSIWLQFNTRQTAPTWLAEEDKIGMPQCVFRPEKVARMIQSDGNTIREEASLVVAV